MNGFRYKIYRFMQGRRGIDQFDRFLLAAALVMMLGSMFFGWIRIIYVFLYYVGSVLFIYAYFRAFSRNLYKREMENNWYLAMKYKLTKGKSLRQRRYERSIYTYFKCPGCGQKMRAPKGKGTIKVTCHQCNTEFNRKV